MPIVVRHDRPGALVAAAREAGAAAGEAIEAQRQAERRSALDRLILARDEQAKRSLQEAEAKRALQRQEYEYKSALSGREMTQKAALAEQEQAAKREMVTWELSQQQKMEMQKLEGRLQWVDSNPDLTPFAKTNMKMAIREQMAGIKPTPRPYDKPWPKDQEPGKTWVDPRTGSTRTRDISTGEERQLSPPTKMTDEQASRAAIELMKAHGTKDDSGKVTYGMTYQEALRQVRSGEEGVAPVGLMTPEQRNRAEEEAIRKMTAESQTGLFPADQEAFRKRAAAAEAAGKTPAQAFQVAMEGRPALATELVMSEIPETRLEKAPELSQTFPWLESQLRGEKLSTDMVDGLQRIRQLMAYMELLGQPEEAARMAEEVKARIRKELERRKKPEESGRTSTQPPRHGGSAGGTSGEPLPELPRTFMRGS